MDRNCAYSFIPTDVLAICLFSTYGSNFRTINGIDTKLNNYD